ncbi:MAG: hypothetical protein R3195_19605 [Gemmatimonadota bacterium]|nr:hypothetical protein [Gemmatimonadota bacterium]
MARTSNEDAGIDRQARLAQAQALTLRLLTRATIPLVIVIILTVARIAVGTFGQRGTTILLYGALVAAVAMFVYALPTVFMAQGKPRPWWTGIASVLGVLPLLYGLYLGAIGGALGAIRAENLVEAGLGVLFLLAGFAYVRDFSRLAVLGRGIEATISTG